MRTGLIVPAAAILTLGVQAGCQTERIPPTAPAPLLNSARVTSRVALAPPQTQLAIQEDASSQESAEISLATEQSPRTARFIDAYEQVGRPRLFIRVTSAPADARDQTSSHAFDYSTIQASLDDCFSFDGTVSLISPDAERSAARQAGNASPSEILTWAERLHADVLILVRIEPTHKNGIGDDLRLIADASNVSRGEPLAHVITEVPTPSDPRRLENSTRLLARKLMADITAAWTGLPSEPQPATRPVFVPVQASVSPPG